MADASHESAADASPDAPIDGADTATPRPRPLHTRHDYAAAAEAYFDAQSAAMVRREAAFLRRLDYDLLGAW